MRIGVISDTHGLMRSTALDALRGVDHILHGGDAGSAEVLAALSAIAPVTAVRGNVDRGAWAEALPERTTARLGDVNIHMLHNIADLQLLPPGCSAVVYGHSHKASAEWRDGVLFLNPGSAGPRRFRLPVTLAILTIEGGELTTGFVHLAG